MTQLTMEDLFGETIHTYTREQAIEDGFLADAQEGDLAGITREHFGECPVYIAHHLFTLITKAVANPRTCNSWDGVLHDLFQMAKFSGLRRLQAGRTMVYTCIITGAGRVRNHKIFLNFDGSALTFMLAEDN